MSEFKYIWIWLALLLLVYFLSYLSFINLGLVEHKAAALSYGVSTVFGMCTMSKFLRMGEVS